jgi:hypothetical protein
VIGLGRWILTIDSQVRKTFEPLGHDFARRKIDKGD